MPGRSGTGAAAGHPSRRPGGGNAGDGLGSGRPKCCTPRTCQCCTGVEHLEGPRTERPSSCDQEGTMTDVPRRSVRSVGHVASSRWSPGSPTAPDRWARRTVTS